MLIGAFHNCLVKAPDIVTNIDTDIINFDCLGLRVHASVTVLLVDMELRPVTAPYGRKNIWREY
jgi:hypothetical protein